MKSSGVIGRLGEIGKKEEALQKRFLEVCAKVDKKEEDYAEIAAYLNHKKNVNVKDGGGKYPLDYALEQRDAKLYDILVKGRIGEIRVQGGELFIQYVLKGKFETKEVAIEFLENGLLEQGYNEDCQKRELQAIKDNADLFDAELVETFKKVITPQKAAPAVVETPMEGSLLAAVQAGDIRKVRKILAQAKMAGNIEEVLNEKSAKLEETALMYAIESGNYEMFLTIFNAAKNSGTLKAQLLAQSAYGKSVLSCAEEIGDTAMVKTILLAAIELGIFGNVMRQNYRGQTVFSAAATGFKHYDIKRIIMSAEKFVQAHNDKPVKVHNPAQVFGKPLASTLFMHLHLNEVAAIKRLISLAEKEGNIEELLTARSDENTARVNKGETAIMVAARTNPEILAILTNAASDANILESALRTSNSYGRARSYVNSLLPQTALAAVDQAKKLANEGFGDGFKGAITQAKQDGQLKYLLNYRYSKGQTLFTKAVSENDKQKIDYLIGEIVEAGLAKRQLAEGAFIAPTLGLFEKLLDKALEANVLNDVLSVVDKNGHTLLEDCIISGNRERVELILQKAKAAKICPDILCCETAKYGSIIATPILKNIHNSYDIYNAILIAAKEGEVVPELLTTIGINGKTLFIKAIEDGDRGLLSQIIFAAKDAKISSAVMSAKGANGDNALILALKLKEVYSESNCIHQVIKSIPDESLKAQLLEQDSEGKSAIMYAIEHAEAARNESAFNQLFEAADRLGIMKEVLLAKDKKGETVLMKAAELLLDKVDVVLKAAEKIDIVPQVINAKDNKGRTVIDYAERRGYRWSNHYFRDNEKHEWVDFRSTNIKKFERMHSKSKLEDVAIRLVTSASSVDSLKNTSNKYKEKTALGKFFYELFGSYGIKGDIRKEISQEILDEYTKYKNSSRTNVSEVKKEVADKFNTEAVRVIKETIEHDHNKKNQPPLNRSTLAHDLRCLLTNEVILKFNEGKSYQIKSTDLNDSVLEKIETKLVKLLEDKTNLHYSKREPVIEPRIIKDLVNIIVKEVRSLDKKHYAEKLLKEEVAPPQR